MYLKEMAEGGYSPDKIDLFHISMVPWLLSYYRVGTSEAIVDIGAGQGHCLLPLYESGWRNLTAVDIDDYNFRYFRERYGIKTISLNIESDHLPLADGDTGAVLCFHLIEHLHSPENLLRESYRVLRPGGRLFLVTPDWRKQYKTFWRDPTHVHPYDKEALARLLRMYGFDAEVHSWGTVLGLGRLQSYRYFPRTGLIGLDILAVARRT